MESRLTMTENAVLEALREALGSSHEIDAGAMTATELSDALDLSSSAVQKRVGKLVRQGYLEVVRKELVDTYGRRQRVPAYRPKTKLRVA